uniref:Interleukin-12 subunit alpha n=1 Tax=Nomascus leucogenys TaxID=61853 RepID=G1QWH2_NOMLE
MWPPGSASQPPPSPAAATGLHLAARPVSLQCRLSMCPARSLLLVATLVLLDHLSLARNLPVATPGPGMFPCLHHSQNLLRAVSNMLQKARQTLEFYPCTSEEIDHEDITKDKTSTVEACLPLELTKNESCLNSRETSFITVSQKMKSFSLYDEFISLIETVPQKSSLEEPDFYKTKIKLCILLHAFRIRAVTIDRVMSYLNAS